jgi:hypothetical protein
MLVEPVFIPLLAGGGRYHLLREDIERLLRNDQPVEPAFACAAEQCGALDQLVPGQREHPPFRNRAQPVPGPPHSL